MGTTVYFSPTVSAEKVRELCVLADKPLPGRVSVKVHSGEKGNQNFLRPDFRKSVIDWVGGTVVECNTAYKGERDTTGKPHLLERINSRNGVHTIEAAAALGIGSRSYELIEVK